MARVVLENVVKSYGSLRAVNDVSLMVEDGEFVALVGPSLWQNNHPKLDCWIDPYHFW